MGGRSSEHEVSLSSARSVVEGLDPERYEVVPIEIPRDGPWLPAEVRMDVAGMFPLSSAT